MSSVLCTLHIHICTHYVYTSRKHCPRIRVCTHISGSVRHNMHGVHISAHIRVLQKLKSSNEVIHVLLICWFHKSPHFANMFRNLLEKKLLVRIWHTWFAPNHRVRTIAWLTGAEFTILTQGIRTTPSCTAVHWLTNDINIKEEHTCKTIYIIKRNTVTVNQRLFYFTNVKVIWKKTMTQT